MRQADTRVDKDRPTDRQKYANAVRQADTGVDKDRQTDRQTSQGGL